MVHVDVLQICDWISSPVLVEGFRENLFRCCHLCEGHETCVVQLVLVAMSRCALVMLAMLRYVVK